MLTEPLKYYITAAFDFGHRRLFLLLFVNIGVIGTAQKVVDRNLKIIRYCNKRIVIGFALFVFVAGNGVLTQIEFN